MVHGLSKTLNNKLMGKLRGARAPLSLNMDEATATNNVPVCSLLVCYFNSVNIVTEHLDTYI